MQTILTDITTATPRVEHLRQQALDHTHQWQASREGELAAARSWLASGAESSNILRRGMQARDILCGLTPVIDDDELLVGKFSTRPLTAEEEEELDRWRRYGEPAMDRADGQRSHMAVDYPALLGYGIAGIRAQIERYRSMLDIVRPADLEKDDFYRTCLRALDGVVTLAGKYAELAEVQAGQATSERRVELLEIARICRKVPEQPAETFHEALQAVHFLTFCLCAGNRMLLFQLGRPDRYLLPYYRGDLAAGRLTAEQAQELIDCTGILLNEYTPRGLAVGWMVGGRDQDGCDVTNELTYHFIQAIGHIRLAYPGVGLCWTTDTPADLLALACRLLARGYSHPALFNDEVITRGLCERGLPLRDACQYIHSTCVEITPIAISNVYVASPYYNLVQNLHDVLGIPPVGDPLGELPPIGSFTELLDRLKMRLAQTVRDGVIGINRDMMSRAKNGGFPLLSCFVNDCLPRGRDIDHGGARANWIESSFVGLANLVDALAAIRQVVFIEEVLSLAELKQALLADFIGYEPVRAQLARVPKYGNDDDGVDGLAVEVTGWLREICDRHRTYWDGPVVPGLFCWIMHETLGRSTGASADGRSAGFPLADGSGPAQGRERQGPTAAIRSVTKWAHAPLLGGIAVNLRFQSQATPEALVMPMAQVLETFLRLGGFEAQVNVVDAGVLIDARDHPDQHRDLVVRVAGYSDYYISLPPGMQEEILMRTEMTL